MLLHHGFGDHPRLAILPISYLLILIVYCSWMFMTFPALSHLHSFGQLYVYLIVQILEICFQRGKTWLVGPSPINHVEIHQSYPRYIQDCVSKYQTHIRSTNYLMDSTNYPNIKQISSNCRPQRFCNSPTDDPQKNASDRPNPGRSPDAQASFAQISIFRHCIKMKYYEISCQKY